MNVIGHQAVGVDRIAVASLVSAKSFEIGPVVGVIKEGPPSLVAADNDVVEEPGSKYSGSASHRMRL